MAKYLGFQGKPAEAVKLYEKLMNQFPEKELSYQPLMLIYRQSRYYKSELKVIDKGIQSFSECYQRSTDIKDKMVISPSK